jgi:hypothetical protein
MPLGILEGGLNGMSMSAAMLMFGTLRCGLDDIPGAGGASIGWTKLIGVEI